MKKIFLVFFILVFLTICILLIKVDSKKEKVEYKDYDYCIEMRVMKTVVNSSMQPMIMSGEEIMLYEGYYNCNDIERGDVIAYRSGAYEYPIIKIISAIGGDTLEFQENNLIINNNILKNSAGVEYSFKENEKKMINLYLSDGKLVENTYLIFGDNTKNSEDSRKFGAISKEGIMGKFIIEK